MQSLVNPKWLMEAEKTIKVIQKTYHISQAQIARMLDIPDKTLNAWLTHRVKCRHDKMLCLAVRQLREQIQKEWS